MVKASHNEIHTIVRFIKDRLLLIENTIPDYTHRLRTMQDLLRNPQSGLTRNEANMIILKFFTPEGHHKHSTKGKYSSKMVASSNRGGERGSGVNLGGLGGGGGGAGAILAHGNSLSKPPSTDAATATNSASNSNSNTAAASAIGSGSGSGTRASGSNFLGLPHHLHDSSSSLRSTSTSTNHGPTPTGGAGARGSERGGGERGGERGGAGGSGTTALLHIGSSKRQLFSENMGIPSQEIYDTVAEARLASIMRDLLEEAKPESIKNKLLSALEKEASVYSKAKGLTHMPTFLPASNCFQALSQAGLRLHRSQVMGIISWATCYDKSVRIRCF
jgi:hypothetical protein